MATAARQRRPAVIQDVPLLPDGTTNLGTNNKLRSNTMEEATEDYGTKETLPVIRLFRRCRRQWHIMSTVFLATLYLLIQMVSLTLFVQTAAVVSTHSVDYEADCLFFAKKASTGRPAVLIVGGSDGSGTRAVVDTLGSLGVTVVADDDQTLDIHASTMFRKQGWPKLVTTILDATGGSITHEFDTLPNITKQILGREMASFQTYIARKYATERRRNRQQVHRYRHLKPNQLHDEDQHRDAQASKVAFVIKAPATMLVLPILWSFLQPIQFIHVVRDGRDVALSDNQSPVIKFYNATYPRDYQERSTKYQGGLYPVRGIQLWNDWNLHAHHWATAKAREESSSSTSFDYLLVRTEDLVDPFTRFQVLTRLADYVGSSLTPHQLCCMAKAPTRDYGQSNIHSETKNENGRGGGGGEVEKRRSKSRSWSVPTDYAQDGDENVHAQRRVTRKEIRAEHIERQHVLGQSQDVMAGEHDRYDMQRRRRLLDGPPKMVPSQFLKQLATWQETVHTNAADFHSETLQKLIDYGHSLLTQLENNRSELESEVSPEEIQKTCDFLQKLLDDRGPVHPIASKGKKSHPDVSLRYGKWKEKLANRTQLSHLLHQEGKEVLELFGYDPRRKWDYRLKPKVKQEDGGHEFVCDANIACGRRRYHMG